MDANKVLTVAKTTILKINSISPQAILESLQPAIKCLQGGKPVGMPTETVYGLAANALDAEASRQIFLVKNRPSDNPLIVHISSLEMLNSVTRLDMANPNDELANRFRPVIERFWPGPLTLLLPKNDMVPDVVTCGLDTVAVRFPSHPIAQALIAGCGFPLAAPSANLSGRPSPTTAQHVYDDLYERIEFIIDGGACESGVESTVLDLIHSPPVILRPGVISAKMLQSILPNVQIYRQSKPFPASSLNTADPSAKADNHCNQDFAEEPYFEQDRPPTPGLKYRHYSPNAPVALFSKSKSNRDIQSYINEQLNQAKRVVWLLPSKVDSFKPTSDLYHELYLSETGELTEIAHRLFAALREADKLQPDLIVAQEIDEHDEGLAIMNRLSKAASLFLD